MNSYDERYRVFNRCKYDIGVKTINGLNVNIKAGGFQMLTANDILYIESICTHRKFFSAKMLVPVGEDGKDIDIENIGIYQDSGTQEHMNDDEIIAMLKKSNKQIEAWLKDINEPSELHSIYLVAKKMDISTGKLKILHDKMPDKEWFEEE